MKYIKYFIYIPLYLYSLLSLYRVAMGITLTDQQISYTFFAGIVVVTAIMIASMITDVE